MEFQIQIPFARMQFLAVSLAEAVLLAMMYEHQGFFVQTNY